MNDINSSINQSEDKTPNMAAPQQTIDEAATGLDNDLADAIRRLEFQQAQLELGARFQRNMEVFKKSSPDLYEEYVSYTPTELQLVLEDDCTINMVNIADNSRVYIGDPKEFCERQVHDYLLKPTVTDIGLSSSEGASDSYIAPHLYKELLESYQALELEHETNTDVPVGLLLMIGCGLGYQLIELIRELDITNMCIVEPHKDCFYASLHTIEWSEMQEYFSQNGRFLKLHLGPDEAKIENIVGPLVDYIGLHNVVHTFTYKHIDSELEEKFTESYQSIFYQCAMGIGFFDDERISLAHTLSNLEKKSNIFCPQAPVEKLPPVFIVGNGPSLDDLLPFLEKEQGNAIIFSAGTTLGSLYKAGIKPDFHIEMERVALVADWINAGSDAEFREGIVALGLNTVHPNSLDGFDRVGLAKKCNDLGAVILDAMCPDLTIATLPICNPTVTNCALSYALSMGFKEIYFIGVDLGTTEDGRHHSSKSLYVDLENKDKENFYSHYTDETLTFKVPGNFSTTVSTSTVLDQSRSNIETLLSYFSVDAFNPSKGARIDGADAISADDIQLPTLTSNKAELVAEIFGHNFVEVDAQFDKEGLTIFNNFFKLRSSLKLKEHPKSIREALQEINRVYRTIRSLELSDPTSMMLLKGSTNILFTLMYKAMIYTKTPESFRKAYRTGWLVYNKFIQQAYDVIKTKPYDLDDSSSDELSEL